jgi:hypothetical protein
MEERRGERGNGTKGAGQASNAKPASTRNTTSHMMLVQRAGLPLCASILRPVSPENIMMRQAKISPHTTFPCPTQAGPVGKCGCFTWMSLQGSRLNARVAT